MLLDLAIEGGAGDAQLPGGLGDIAVMVGQGAANGVALQILHDSMYRPVFMPPPVSQPAAYMYLLALVFGFEGVSLASLPS